MSVVGLTSACDGWSAEHDLEDSPHVCCYFCMSTGKWVDGMAATVATDGCPKGEVDGVITVEIVHTVC